jgi:hypothetical protein
VLRGVQDLEPGAAQRGEDDVRWVEEGRLESRQRAVIGKEVREPLESRYPYFSLDLRRGRRLESR